jgi:hypothetical protein
LKVKIDAGRLGGEFEGGGLQSALFIQHFFNVLVNEQRELGSNIFGLLGMQLDFLLHGCDGGHFLS